MLARGVLAVSACAVAGLVFPAASAYAAPAVPFQPNNVSNTLFAGYALAKAPAIASASATLVVPKLLSCTATTSAVGAVVAVTTRSGTTVSSSGVLLVLECASGKPLYGAFGEIYGSPTFLPVVAPGDTLLVTVSVTSTVLKVTFADATKHSSKTLSGPGAVGTAVDEGMALATQGGNPLPIPNFGTMSFSAAKMDGKTPAAVHAVATDMRTKGGTLQIATGALSATGNRWTETFKHS
jgi:hypothetical protein